MLKRVLNGIVHRREAPRNPHAPCLVAQIRIHNITTTSIPCHPILPPNDLIMQIITATQRLFHLSCPHEWQIGIIQDLLVQSHCSNNKTNMLVVRPTGRQISSVSFCWICHERDNIIYLSTLIKLKSFET